MEEKTYQFLQSLTEIEALKFGNFTLASGDTTSFYLDLRYLPCYPKIFQKVTQELHNRISSLHFDAIIALPLAGLPFGTALSLLSNKPLHLMRKEQKSHGGKKSIEGPLISGKTILLVDDLISSGYSKEYALDLIRKDGGIVNDISVIVDRRLLSKQNSFDWEQNHKVSINGLYTLTHDLLEAFQNSLQK